MQNSPRLGINLSSQNTKLTLETAGGAERMEFPDGGPAR